jgi:small subunit ribosomal protein S16
VLNTFNFYGIINIQNCKGDLMVKLRLKRTGKKFSAFYRIVAADARAPRDGRFIEQIGYFNPHSKELKIDKILALK